MSMVGTMASDNVNGMFRASQAFGVLGLITYFSSIVCCCIVFCWPRPWKRTLLYSASATSLATVLFTMLTLVLFFKSHPDHGSRLDFGYYIAIAACVVSLFVTVCAFYIARITSFPPKKTPTIEQELAVIDLDALSVTSSQSWGHGSTSMEVPIILRELTAENFTQIPPEFQSYREETKAGPSFFFNLRPSDDVIQKLKLRNEQNQSKLSPSVSRHSLTAQNLTPPSPSFSRRSSAAQNLTPSNVCETSHSTTISVTHLGVELDSSRCTTPVEEVETESTTV
ncbi:uncharacterized protein [Argopecten irradians]|uniref:uncharacterized protein isoform X2 n=1 Tax=Argopecten irradians TaxID=31199 RepID=UPI003716E80C